MLKLTASLSGNLWKCPSVVIGKKKKSISGKNGHLLRAGLSASHLIHFSMFSSS